MGDNKNFVLFAVLSFAILMGYQYFYAGPKLEAQRQYEEQLRAQQAENGVTPTDDIAPATGTPAPVATPQVGAAYEDAGSIRIETPELSGSLSLRGARFDDLQLNNHRVELESDARVQLLKQFGDDDAYFVRFGWVARDKGGDFVPGNATAWTANASTLTPDSPVQLTWTNDVGVTFVLDIAVDEQFMFSVNQSVINNSGEDLAIAPFGRITRWGRPATDGLYILHEGPIGVVAGELQELTYDDLEDDGNFENSTTGGWLGITDKFWMTALIPNQ